MKNTYVIGLSPKKLLNIQDHYDYDRNEYYIWRLMHSVPFIEATLISGLDDAKHVLNEIQERYNEILIMAPTVFHSVIHGNDFDPMQLHIYRVELREVM